MSEEVERDGRVSEALLDAIIPPFLAPATVTRFPALLARLRDQVTLASTHRLRQTIAPLGRLIFGRQDALDILGSVQARAVILAGREDRSRPPADSTLMAEFPGCDLPIAHTALRSNSRHLLTRFLQSFSARAATTTMRKSTLADGREPGQRHHHRGHKQPSTSTT